MGDLNVVDHFLQTFITYIDSGFGFLQGDVKKLTTILIGIDITMAGLFWAFDGDAMLLARLIKKVLYVGAFALILNNFTVLAGTIFKSFAGLGLNAAHSGMTADDLLKPGKLAGAGFTAAWPLLEQAGKLVGFTSFLDHLITIIVLVFAWIVVVLSFFLLAVQLFVTILEFKLTCLAGFVLVPFALWNKTSFLAERVLGHVVTSGIKVMVLAVIVGIGTTFFGTFTAALGGHPIGLADAMSLVLAALSLFGLGIFGPAIATGLVSGAPQLGAGAVLGTATALTATTVLAGGAAVGGARMIGGAGIAAIRAGTALSSGAATAYGLGQATSGASGMAGVGAGLSGVAKAGAGAARNAFSDLGSKFSESAQAGRQAAFRATGGKIGGGGAAQEPSPEAPGEMPKWAKRLRSEQRNRARIQGITQAIREGDRPGGSAMPNLKEEGN
jgi:type IV secretion system protein TrbL